MNFPLIISGKNELRRPMIKDTLSTRARVGPWWQASIIASILFGSADIKISTLPSGALYTQPEMSPISSAFFIAFSILLWYNKSLFE